MLDVRRAQAGTKQPATRFWSGSWRLLDTGSGKGDAAHLNLFQTAEFLDLN
jgi:hypothetical protein